MGRAPRTKETMLNFMKWRRVTRLSLVFRWLTGSQRTPGFGASQYLPGELFQLFKQVLVGDAERLHLARVGLHSL